MRKFGLVGRNISYSFSRSYFSEKFEKLKIDASYENFDIAHISEFPTVVKNNKDLQGLNITIPYKEKVIQYLDELDSIATEIGAVNTVKFLASGKLKGFNTDQFGFTESLRPALQATDKKALILGTGGASKAVAYSLRSLGLDFKFVSRRAAENVLGYNALSKKILQEHQVIVNCTPLGTSPKTEAFPPIPTDYIDANHLVFDLIYNPAQTTLMRLASEKDARTLNGRRMLELQAEKAWEIWNSREA